MHTPIIPPSFFVIDVESIGLHGEAFAVAGGLYLPDGSVQWEFSLSCPLGKCRGEDSDRLWVTENVPVLEVTHRNPKSMRDDFWKKWMYARSCNAVMAADCLWPVEASFIEVCVTDDFPARNWDGPYPFFEISTFMMAAGFDPKENFARLPSELPKHNPLADVRQSARLLSEALKRLSTST